MAITPLPPADFTPSMGSYNTPGTFRFWCQKVLPLVYDDSLSYYELLCKVVDYLNKTMEDVNTSVEDVTALHDAYDELQTYVNTYFSSLDVQEEIDNKLDAMAEDGRLTALIAPQLPALIASWLSENLTPTTPPIDKTLTIENAAADAKTVGDIITNVKESLFSGDDAIGNYIGFIPYWGDGITAQYNAQNKIERTSDFSILNMDGNMSASRFYCKLSDALQVATNSTAFGKFAKTVNIKAGHVYKLKSEVISGSYSRLQDHENAQIAVRLRTSENTDLVTETGYDYGIGIESEKIFTVESDITCAVVLVAFLGIVANNLKLKITLVDLTQFLSLLPDSDTSLSTPGGYADAKTTGEKITDLRDSVNSNIAAFSPILGIYHYWNNSETSQYNTENSLNRVAQNVKINLDGSYPGNRLYFKINDDVQTATNTTAFEKFSKTVLLKAEHKYKFIVKKISGTLSNTEDHENAFMCVRLRTADNTDILKETGLSYGVSIDTENDFTVDTDTLCAIVITSSIGLIADNLSLDIVLIDLTEFKDTVNKVISNSIPDYYFDNSYLQSKTNNITQLQNSIGVNNDAFWFITDYHTQYNAKHSTALLHYLMTKTGIDKIFFGGDSAGARGSSETAVYNALQRSAEAWEALKESTGEMFGVLGNHEWISSNFATMSGMMGAYLNKFKNKVPKMDAATGNYYFDNVANKIRYIFIQDTISSYPVNGSIDWLYNTLIAVPANYSICVVMHHGYIPSEATQAEYDGAEVTYNYSAIKGVSRLLAACRDKVNLQYASGVNYDFSGLSGTRYIIGIFCGHIHHGFLYTGSTEEGIENIAVFRGSTDGLSAGLVAVNGHPWFWENGIVGGTKIERTEGTIYEQCFYCVQIDMDAKVLHITAIGGDHDWSGTYQN